MLLAVLTIFLACLGACIGSFLNVVIYRLPRGMSVSRPRRSFCPSCGRQIEWYDNIPVISWIGLGGRCRWCGLPISLQYPLIELAGVVVTMIVWHAARGYCADMPADACWPMIAGLLGLFYCLLALSAMDLENYYVDIRLTWLALLIGLVCHAISPAGVWPAGQYVGPAWGAFAVGCTAALALLHWLWPPLVPEELPIDTPTEQTDSNPSGQTLDSSEQVSGPSPQGTNHTAVHQTATRASHIGLVLLLAAITAGLVVSEVAASQATVRLVPAWLPIGGGLAVLFASILAGSWLPTEADQAIAEAVESERSFAVGQALTEGAVLVASVLAGAALMWLVQRPGTISDVWASVFTWAPWEGVQPVAGLATALTGWVIAGGACWVIRVLFTLALRKEALGFGDIHIIAGVGAVLGPHLAIAGFFLAAPVALMGTAVLMFRKSYRTLPFGPWLSLGFLLATLWGRQLVRYLSVGIEGIRQGFGW